MAHRHCVTRSLPRGRDKRGEERGRVIDDSGGGRQMERVGKGRRG